MQHVFRTIVASALAFFSLLSSSSIACAQERQKSFRVQGYFDMSFGARALSVDHEVLRPAGGATESRIVVDGAQVSPGGLAALDMRFGWAFGPLCTSVGVGVGLGRGMSGYSQQVGDIVVRPSGFAAAMNVSIALGAMFTTSRLRGRFEGYVGDEIAGFGMERPGFADTKVPAVNVERWTYGPRLSLELPLADGWGGLGLVLQTDARAPKNVFLALQLSTMSF